MCFKNFILIMAFYFTPLIHCDGALEIISKNETYFPYSAQDLNGLRTVPVSKQLLSNASFAKWDPILYQLTQNENNIDGSANRLMAYLYAAQRDFALLSYQVSQEWVGNPDQMIVKIIHLFYPEYQDRQEETDIYSGKIGDLIFQKINDRFTNEQSRLKEYPALSAPEHWHENPPFIGRRIGSCQPWLFSSIAEFRSPKPPGPNSIIWIYGVEQIQEAQANLTPEQLKLIHYWAGELGPESGNWFAISNKEIEKKQHSLSNFLFIRALFAMTFTDAMIAVFDSKYTYWVRRPTTLDPKIKPIIAVPKHPSYPSAHSSTSSAAAVILTHFFPEQKEKWQALAIQAGNTRIWAGLHFIYDHVEGLIQGEKVGNAILKKVEQ